jgi:prolyl 4-hydroxylase
MVGGETSFPRYVNAESFHKLKVTPEAGKAVLFYSQLPDGNMDDFSQHAAGMSQFVFAAEYESRIILQF